MSTLALLATPAAILALVNLAKRFGVSGAWSALLAVILGVALSVSDLAFGGNAFYVAGANGLLMGLGAAGIYDVVATVAAPKADSTEASTRYFDDESEPEAVA